MVVGGSGWGGVEGEVCTENKGHFSPYQARCFSSFTKTGRHFPAGEKKRNSRNIFNPGTPSEKAEMRHEPAYRDLSLPKIYIKYPPLNLHIFHIWPPFTAINRSQYWLSTGCFSLRHEGGIIGRNAAQDKAKG